MRVGRWFTPRAVDAALGGEMKDRRRPPRGNRGTCGRLSDIGVLEPRSIRKRAIRRVPEIVDDHHVRARREQGLNAVHADESRASRDDDAMAGHALRH